MTRAVSLKHRGKYPQRIFAIHHDLRTCSILAPLLLVVLLLPKGIDGAEDTATALISKVWAQYRSVETEREEIEMLLLASPEQDDYTAQDAQAMVGEDRPGLTHKRAVRHVQYAEDHRDKLHLLFSLPAEDDGLGYLVWRRPGKGGDDTWLYMPGYRAVRRVSGTSNKRLAGTDLLYEDARELSGERTERYTYNGLSRAVVDGRSCEVVRAEPKRGTTTAYQHRKIWIDTERLFPLKIEYYDHAGKLWKILYNRDLREVAADVWRANLTEMRDVQANRTTLLLTAKRGIHVEIAPRVFTKDYLVHPGGG